MVNKEEIIKVLEYLKERGCYEIACSECPFHNLLQEFNKGIDDNIQYNLFTHHKKLCHELATIAGSPK